MRISSHPKVWTCRGLVTFYTVFVIELASRRVQILGSTPHPDEAFMCQVARTLTRADGQGYGVLISTGTRSGASRSARGCRRAGSVSSGRRFRAPDANAAR